MGETGSVGTESAKRAQLATPDFAAVDRRLREILEPLRSRLVATKDGPDGLILQIPGLEDKPWGYVGGIRLGKRYVSFYLMSVYASPEIVESMSPELRRRMQGKSCFNFTTVDEPLFAELAQITEASFEPYLALAAEVARKRA
jgi:hypothetical protein